MSFDVAAETFNVELRKRRIVRTGAGEQHVVNWCRQLVEEPFEPVEVGGVEGRDAGPKLQTHTVQTVGIACCEDYRRSSGTGEPSRCETNTGAPPDHDDGLPEHVLLPLCWRKGGRGHRGSSFQSRVNPRTRRG